MRADLSLLGRCQCRAEQGDLCAPIRSPTWLTIPGNADERTS